LAVKAVYQSVEFRVCKFVCATKKAALSIGGCWHPLWS